MSGDELERRTIEGRVVDPPSGFIVPPDLLDWYSSYLGTPYTFGPFSDRNVKVQFGWETEANSWDSEGWAHCQESHPVTLCDEHARQLVRVIRRDRWRERLLRPSWFSWDCRMRLTSVAGRLYHWLAKLDEAE